MPALGDMYKKMAWIILAGLVGLFVNYGSNHPLPDLCGNVLKFKPSGGVD